MVIVFDLPLAGTGASLEPRAAGAKTCARPLGQVSRLASSLVDVLEEPGRKWVY